MGMNKEEQLIGLRKKVREQIQFLQKAETEGTELTAQSHIDAWKGFMVRLRNVINQK